AFARIGLIPDAGGTYWLPRQVGFARAMGAALFADSIPATKAAEWGMIWEAVPDGEFEETWRQRATHLANGPGVALRDIKTALRKTYSNSLDDQLMLEAQLQGECGGTRDFKEGVLAFVEKRPAVYEGR
ncbi:MAG: enoyl-CoA hydratase-related protein, partial [Pseudomonadota bacterium]